jgi:hypothetical protein
MNVGRSRIGSVSSTAECQPAVVSPKIYEKMINDSLEKNPRKTPPVRQIEPDSEALLIIQVQHGVGSVREGNLNFLSDQSGGK